MKCATFRLSFSAMNRWFFGWLAWVAGIGLLLLLVMGLAFFLLGRLPINLLLSAVMLSLSPVLVMVLLAVPLVLLTFALLAAGYRLQVNEDGLIQSLGPFRQTLDWLQIQSATWETPVRIRLFRLLGYDLSYSMTLYVGFLDNPARFEQAVRALAPTESVMQQ